MLIITKNISGVIIFWLLILSFSHRINQGIDSPYKTCTTKNISNCHREQVIDEEVSPC